MERLENTSNSTIDKTLALINEKINNFIDLVNSNEKNLKISKNLQFDESRTPIYKNKKILHHSAL